MQLKPRAIDTDFKAVGSLPERKSLGQNVYENLKQAIVQGDLSPKSRIIESRLAESLGISRTPVREAIHKLEREGLLRRGSTGGFFVTGLNRRDIEETFGIRSVLESYAAKLAAMKHNPRELDLLEEKIRDYQAALDRGRTEILPEINTAFHDHLYTLSHSPRLIRMINELHDHIYRFRKVLLQSEELARTSNRDHRDMIRAIRKGDAEGVEKLVKEHILRGREVVLHEFDLGNIQ
jgi:DNA-binding GntR family transcriptional regulator